jgi:hypothetical protein
MSSRDSNGKTVPVAQNENESGDEERVQGALYGEASDVRSVRDAERMRQYDAVQYPGAEERDVEFDLSIDGVPGDEIGQKRAEQGRLDRGTDEAVNGSWGGPGGESEYDDKSLYTQERIEAREAELEAISTRAGANPEVHPRPEEKQAREERTMELHQTRMEECREEVEAQGREGIVARGYVDDPREHLANETVGEIYEQSVRVAKRYGQTRHVAAKRIAEKVANGADVGMAVMNLVEELCEDRSVVTPMKMVEPTDSWGTIEGVVTRLFDPATSNQQQVAIVEDESDSAKLTIWRNSNQNVRVNKGDVIRVIDGKPSGYNGQLTLAATSDTQIWVREKGDGPSPMGGVEIDANSGPSGEIDEDEPKSVTRYNGREQWYFKMAEDMPVPEGFTGTLPSFNGVGARENVRTRENPATGAVAYLAISDKAHDSKGVSWGAAVRREAEERGRQKRIDERKYNVPEWKRTTSRIDHYEHTSISEFGADDRMVHLDLPALSSDK